MNSPSFVEKNMFRFALSLLLLLPVSLLSADPPRPDIVIFLADDLGYADVGFNGGRDIPTPHLDQLAAGGAVLESFYVQTVCSPTRAALMTGRYPMRYGLQQGVIRPGDEYGLPLQERTLAQALREAGYTTAITGKWHLGEFNPVYQPTRRGFDLQYGHFFGALDYSTHLRDGKRDWYRNDQPSDEEGYTTRLLAKEAARIVREQPRDRPLFLYVPFNAVHSPYHTAPGRENDFASLPPARRQYATMLSEMDTAIGQVLTALRETGRSQSLIFFSSDNGGTGPASNGHLRAGKGTPYEGGHRVAACIAWEGHIKAGQRIREPLHIVDLFPTLAGMTGVSIAPPQQKRPLDGLNILPVLTSQARSPHDAILLHETPSESALRMGDWKLILRHESRPAFNSKKSRKKAPTVSAPVELFNLANDPGETTNLADREPEQLQKLQSRLYDFRRQAIVPRSDPSGKVKPATG